MDTVCWALIGAGDIAKKRVAPALRNLRNCELISVSRANAALAAQFAEEFGARSYFADWRDQIADPGVDAVYVATPVFLHQEQTIAAAEAGKHVLCEKPMALDPAECEAMIAACRANNVKLGIAYYRRFYPAIDRVKQILASGEIGRVAVVQINAFERFDPSPGDGRRWFLNKEKSGGGPMMDFGCHRIEVVRNLFGEVTRVERLVSNEVLGREVEDTVTVLMQFESGVCASITVTHAVAAHADTLSVFGARGTIDVPILNDGAVSITVDQHTRVETLPPASNLHEPLIRQFSEAVSGRENPAVSGEDGLAVARIIEQIYRP